MAKQWVPRKALPHTCPCVDKAYGEFGEYIGCYLAPATGIEISLSYQPRAVR